MIGVAGVIKTTCVAFLACPTNDNQNLRLEKFDTLNNISLNGRANNPLIKNSGSLRNYSPLALTQLQLLTQPDSEDSENTDNDQEKGNPEIEELVVLPPGHYLIDKFSTAWKKVVELDADQRITPVSVDQSLAYSDNNSIELAKLSTNIFVVGEKDIGLARDTKALYYSAGVEPPPSLSGSKVAHSKNKARFTIDKNFLRLEACGDRIDLVQLKSLDDKQHYVPKTKKDLKKLRAHNLDSFMNEKGAISVIPVKKSFKPNSAIDKWEHRIYSKFNDNKALKPLTLLEWGLFALITSVSDR